ncbi:PDZ domain-containing protein, partial [Campylobacter fetus]
DSSKLLEGDLVFAIGNPFGVGGSITSGIISGLNKDNIGLNQYEDFIQTDASINPGNSGGALVDSRGALVGINSAILSRSGGNNGIGFAIPSNMVKTIAQKLISDGKITRGYIGVMISNLTDDQKEIYTNKEGALVTNVEKDKPADIAGLKRGDLIIKVGNQTIKNANDLKNLIGSLEPNKEIKITFERSNQIKDTTLKLANMDSGYIDPKDAYLTDGLSLQNLSDEIRYKFQIPKDIKGIIITNVKDDSNAANAGFEAGDIIVQVNEKIIYNVDDFTKEIKSSKAQNKKPIIWINRSGVLMGLVLK